MTASPSKGRNVALIIMLSLLALPTAPRAEEARPEAGCLRTDRTQAVLSCPVGGTPARAGRPRGEVRHGPVLGLEQAPGQDGAARPGRSDRLARFTEVACEAAVPAYRTSLSESPESHDLCALRVRAAECGLIQLTQDRQAEQVGALLSEMQTFLGETHPDEALRDCRELTARTVTRMVTGWHREAVGTDTRPGTLDRATMELASRSYDQVIDAFPDLDTFDFPDWPEGAEPTVVRMRYWQAELLWRRNVWAECGPAFDRVVDLDPEGEYADEAAYAAVLCFNNLYQERTVDDRHAASNSLERHELTALERQLADVYGRYVCRVPESEDSVRVQYRRARTYYQANQWDEAAVLFRRIAESHSSDELAPYAANLYLDSLSAITRIDPERRAACRDELIEAVERFLGDQALTRDAEFRSQLVQLQCGIRWSQAEGLLETERWGEAAERFLEISRADSEQCREFGSHDRCEALYDAALGFEADSQMERAIEVRRELVQRCGDGSDWAREHNGASHWAKRAIYSLAGNHRALLDFAAAASSYEDFARRYPGEAEAPEALANAIVFRLGLGEYDRALEDSRLFESSYGRSQPAKTATVVFALGRPLIVRGEWRGAEKHFDGFLRRFGSSAGPDEVIQAWSGLGLARWNQRTGVAPGVGTRLREGALAAFSAAVALADQGRPPREDQRSRIERYRALLTSSPALSQCEEPEIAVRMLRMKTAVAQARFYLAEAESEGSAAIAIAPLRLRPGALPPEVRDWAARDAARLGPLPSPAEAARIAALQVRHWVEVALTPTLARREGALRRATEAYLAVEDEDVPEWDVAAQARIGEMYADLAASLESLAGDADPAPGSGPIPIRHDLLAARARPYRDQAARAFVRCIRESVDTRSFTDPARRCEAGLRALDPGLLPDNDGFWAEPVQGRAPLAAPEMIRRRHSSP